MHNLSSSIPPLNTPMCQLPLNKSYAHHFSEVFSGKVKKKVHRPREGCCLPFRPNLRNKELKDKFIQKSKFSDYLPSRNAVWNSGKASCSTKHFWSFTAMQCYSILPEQVNNRRETSSGPIKLARHDPSSGIPDWSEKSLQRPCAAELLQPLQTACMLTLLA